MPAYADSSLLLKLYIREPETMAAWQVVNRMQEPIVFTPLHRLEMINGIRRCAATKKVTRAQAVRAMLLLRSHVQSGRYTLPAVPWQAVFSALTSSAGNTLAGCWYARWTCCMWPWRWR